MFSSKKILYFIIISLLLVCYANGIDYRSNAYADYVADGGGEIVDFSDSGFFAVADAGSEVAVVSLPDDDAGGSSDDSASYVVDVDQTTSVPEGGTTAPVGEETAPESETTTTAAAADNGNATSTTTVTTAYTTVTTTTATQPEHTEDTAVYTTEKTYTDSGSMHFEYPSVRIYAGASTVVSLNMPMGVQKLATFSSKDTSIATVRNYSDTTVEITGVSVGIVWIQAINAERNYTAYCRVVVTDFAGEVIRLTNEQRAYYGVAPLAEGGTDIQRMANLRLNEEMRSFSHTRPNGSKFSTAAAELGITYRKIGENLAKGQTTPSQVVTDWMNSPSHRENILNPNYMYISVSYGIRSDGVPFWAQIFYTPVD